MFCRSTLQKGEEENDMAKRALKQSVSGTQVLPQWEKRKQMDDVRASVERAVLELWAQENVRESWRSFGKVPFDALCPKVRKVKDGVEVFDPQASMAINSTIQWLFGTSIGRACAAKLLAVEAEVFRKARKDGSQKTP